MVWGHFFQLLGVVMCAANVTYYYAVEDTLPFGFINVAALGIYSLGATLKLQPWKVWAWHCIALCWNLALFSTVYYWLWNDNFPLSEVWLLAIIGIFFFSLLDNVLDVPQQ